MKIKGKIEQDDEGNINIKTNVVALGIASKEIVDVPAGDIFEDFLGKDVEIKVNEVQPDIKATIARLMKMKTRIS